MQYVKEPRLEGQGGTQGEEKTFLFFHLVKGETRSVIWGIPGMATGALGGEGPVGKGPGGIAVFPPILMARNNRGMMGVLGGRRTDYEDVGAVRRSIIRRRN